MQQGPALTQTGCIRGCHGIYIGWLLASSTQFNRWPSACRLRAESELECQKVLSSTAITSDDQAMRRFRLAGMRTGSDELAPGPTF